MSKDKVKLASKILFSIIVIFLLSRIVALTFKETVKIEAKEAKVYEVSQSNIISSGKEIIIKSFNEEINNIKWANEDELIVDGLIEGISDRYLFSMNDKELKKFDNKEQNVTKDYASYEYIKEIPGYGDLCIKDTSIGLINSDNEFEVIAENATYDGEVKYILSEDSSKLSYYHNGKNKIIIYSFKKASFKSINDEIPENVIRNFTKYVKLSPLGGYLSVEYRTDDMTTSTFSIYGADSGKTYADDVMGVQLSWNADESKVCYYYTGASEVIKGKFYDNDIMSKRIGFYDVSNKKIDYINSTDSEKHMISKIYWYDNRISVLVGSQDEEGNLVVDKILGYNFDGNKFSEISLKESKILTKNSKIELMDLGDSYVLLIDASQSYKIVKIIKDSSEIVLFENLKMIHIDNEALKYYYKDNNSLITTDGNLITVTKPNFQGFIHLNQEEYMIYPSDGLEYIAVWFKQSNEIRILTTE